MYLVQMCTKDGYDKAFTYKFELRGNNQRFPQFNTQLGFRG